MILAQRGVVCQSSASSPPQPLSTSTSEATALDDCSRPLCAWDATHPATPFSRFVTPRMRLLMGFRFGEPSDPSGLPAVAMAAAT
eukprot:CAMPEP_0197528406 /NCGR_PEP_ID=MMETSP1318-20131121/24977_1 /TAXON_ID=552666 /ORGANISM="Partenskyella glossopodia, Strain RCC365" /LENGTH=84 /DNA_ID=CAMNT_0043083493 /DNA_START=521 /DNA_END=771 /DNA_ORIENTATION=+